ncbi:putative DNA glycosylase, plant [Dioscorea sansibarensis]
MLGKGGDLVAEMDMGGDLRMPARRMVDPGGDMGPRTPAKGREGIDLNVGMFRPSFGAHPNQMLLNGRFFLNSGTRLGSLIHNHNHHHDHHNSNGISFGSGSGSDLNLLPNIGGIVNERMVVNENVMPRWRPVAVERCRKVMPPDQGFIDLTIEADTVNNNGEQLVLQQQQQQEHQHQYQIEHHVDLGLSREQNVVLAGDVRVHSESGEGEAVVVAPEGLDFQQLIGERQCVIGEEQVIDLNKTPQQKPKRKKHRPKVIREGKPARRGRTATPKPVTPKPTTERPTGKRKYVRRKNVSNPVETPSEALGECVESQNANGMKSARRSLNFVSGLTGEGCTASASMSVPMSSMNAHSFEYQDRSVSGVHNFSSLNGGGSPAMHARMSLQTRMPLDLGQSTSQNPTWFENPQNSTLNPQLLGRGYATINHVSGEFRGNLGIPTPYPRFQERGYGSISHVQRELGGNPEIPTPPLQPSRNGMVRDNLNSLAASGDIRLRNGLNSSLSDLLLQVARKDHDTNKKRKIEEQNRLPYKAPKNWNLNHVQQTRPSQFTFADAQRFIAVEKMKASDVMVASHRIERSKSMIANTSFQANSLMLAIGSTMNYNLLTTAEKPLGDGNLNSKDPVTPEKLSSRWNRGHDGVIRKPRTRRVNRATDNNAKAKTRNTKEKISPGSICGNANAKITPGHEAVANQENHSRCLKISFIQDCQSSSDFQESAHSTITSLGPMPYRDPVDDIIQKFSQMSINRTPEGVTAEAQHALVPYNGGGTMVPYEGPYDPAKRRRPRPKVDLDPETSRVWRLLLIKDSIDGDTELDKNKEKWWEEERRVFRGRVDSFIARMHLVQGNAINSPLNLLEYLGYPWPDQLTDRQ